MDSEIDTLQSGGDIDLEEFLDYYRKDIIDITVIVTESFGEVAQRMVRKDINVTYEVLLGHLEDYCNCLKLAYFFGIHHDLEYVSMIVPRAIGNASRVKTTFGIP